MYGYRAHAHDRLSVLCWPVSGGRIKQHFIFSCGAAMLAKMSRIQINKQNRDNSMIHQTETVDGDT